MSLFNPKGFSLIELLVVIVIIGILVYKIAFSSYTSFKEKSYAVEGITYARLCINDLALYCANNRGKPFNPAEFESCNRSYEGNYGTLTVNAMNGICTQDGYLPDGYKVVVNTSATPNYVAVCESHHGNIRCFVDNAQ
jgi:prepilin-type N-terminal cleavage/methylation domain-containing protein